MKRFLNRLFAIKPLSAAPTHAGMRRVLGPIDLTLLGVGAIVGTGIFVLSGHVAAQHAGPATALSFALAGLAALLAGLCYAEVACLIPASGSAYTYAYTSMGQAVAWLVGWDLLLEYLLAAASVSVGWSAYVSAFCRHSLGVTLPAALSQAPLRWDIAQQKLVGTGAWINAPAALIVVVLTALLATGMRDSARFNAVTVAIKLITIVLFVAFAASAINMQNYQPFVPPNEGTFGAFGWSGVVQGASILFFAYNGFDAISAAAQEARAPQRDVPLGILASLAIAAVLYIAVALVLTGVVPYPNLAVANPVSLGVERADLPWLQPVVEIGAIAGLTSVMLVNLLSQPRIAYAMAQDGLLPQALGRLHPLYQTPYTATWTGGLLCAGAGAMLPIDVLGELMCVGTLFAFFTVSLGVLILRHRAPDAPRRFRVPGSAWGLPVLSALCCAALLCAAQRFTLLRFGQWVLLGIVTYALYGYRHARPVA